MWQREAMVTMTDQTRESTHQEPGGQSSLHPVRVPFQRS